MFKKIFIIIPVVLLIASICYSIEVAGIPMADSIQSGETRLILNGAGKRTKFFIKLYIGGLYLRQKSSEPQEIMEADEEMAIRMHMISSLITAKKMEKTIRKGFERSTKGKTDPIKEQIEQYVSVFKGGVDKHDIYDLIYIPGKGVEVYKNREEVSLIEGLLFKQALFGIWLSDDPAQKSLKKEMLGL